MTRPESTESSPASSSAAALVEEGFLGHVKAVVLDWDDALAAGGDHRALAERVSSLSAHGVDVVVVTARPSTLGLAPTAPGRLFAWTVDPAGVVEVVAGGAPAPTPNGSSRSAPAAASAGEWARGVLAGGIDTGQVLVVDDPERTVDLLDRVIAAHAGFPEVTCDPEWRLDVDDFDPLREREAESWLSVSNGRTGTRGSLEEAHAESSPAVYVAGIYALAAGRLPGPDLLRGPQWTHLLPRAGGSPVTLRHGETVSHRRILDLRQGLLFREWTQRLPGGEEWRFRSVRFASLADRGILALECEASAEGTPVALADGVPLPPQDGVEITMPGAGPDVGADIVTLTSSTGGAATFASSTSERDGRLERLVAVSRAAGEVDDQPAPEVLASVQQEGIGAIRARHRRAWRDRWRDADVVVGTDTDLQRAVRFAVAHLIASGDPESDLASIGARGLTGPGYRGHVFWDTEVFILPFFIWTHPATARALLSYRHRTLPAARNRAREMGYDGALYAWESADTGEESAPLFAWRADGTRVEILTGLMEHHISADVAWATWHYWEVTGDDEFLVRHGAEIIFETARFWASRAELGPDGRYHIDRIIGPDEYHEGILDNAFTNVLARWNLATAVRLTELVPTMDPTAFEELRRRLGIRPGEVRRWHEVAERMVDGFDPDSLLYEQFAGFFQLEDVLAVDIAPRPFTGDTVLGVPRARRAQMVKQADVLMLPIMLPGLVPAPVAEANYRYYEPRTSHGSSLSPAAHATVAARVGALDDAEHYFRMSAAIDLSDQMGNASQGLHFAAMGGLWQAAVFGFGGVRADGTVLRIDPALPSGWRELSFAVRWRGARVRIEIDHGTLTVDLDRPATIALGSGEPVALGPGRFSSPRSDPSPLGEVREP